jgi:hypothetical protein
MSENTGTVDINDATSTNGSNGTAEVPQLSADQMTYLLNLAAKDQERKEKAEAAKAERKRANGRPTDPTTGKEMPAPLAFLSVAATLLKNWDETYTADEFVQHVRMQFAPMIVSLSNTPSTLLAGAYDNKRRDMEAWIVPAEVRPAKK